MFIVANRTVGAFQGSLRLLLLRLCNRSLN